MPRYTTSNCGFLLGLAAVAASKAIPIKSLATSPFFDPTNTTAAVGDVLEFHFLAHNRSVVMGDWDTACQPAASGGFFSGFFVQDDTTTENPTVFRVAVNDTNPLVYYCSQNGSAFGNHCKDHGMAGMVNQPDLAALQAYRDAAAVVATSVSPGAGAGGLSLPFGGVFAANPDTEAVGGGDASSSSSSSASASASSSTSTTTTTTSAAAAAAAAAGRNTRCGAMAGWWAGGVVVVALLSSAFTILL